VVVAPPNLLLKHIPIPQPLQAHATSQLPGSQPELLGVAPAVFVLLPGNLQRACPAGVLLMQVCVPASAFPGSCTSDGGSNVQCCSTERSANDHMLRVLVRRLVRIAVHA